MGKIYDNELQSPCQPGAPLGAGVSLPCFSGELKPKWVIPGSFPAMRFLVNQSIPFVARTQGVTFLPTSLEVQSPSSSF